MYVSLNILALIFTGAWNGERPNGNNLQCHICGKILSRKQTLKIHMQTHLDCRSMYNCELCPASFTWKENLTRHVRIKHEFIIKKELCAD